MRPHLGVPRPSIVGRLRADPGLLLLIGLVVALTTLLTAAVRPLTERTSDRAVAATVRAAGLRGAVVATLPDQETGRVRDPATAQELRDDATSARDRMPAALADVVRPGIAGLTTSELQLLGNGPGRYVSLTYVDTAQGPPTVRYVAGRPPAASTEQAELELPDDAPAWPVQVALSQAAAAALDLTPGDVLSAQDRLGRGVEIRVSGVFVAVDREADAWRAAPQLLEPVQGPSEGVLRTSAAALVSAAAVPDLRLAAAPDVLARSVFFAPAASRLRNATTAAVAQAVVSLKASPGGRSGGTAWDSLLELVLADARAQVGAARGQAQMLLVGLQAAALLVLVLAARLLVRRRAGPVTLSRERGASLPGIGAELLVESVGLTVAGAGVGLLVCWLLVGAVGWAGSFPVLVVAALAAPVVGVTLASGSSDVRRVPGNRSARRTTARAGRSLRLLVEGVVLAAAVLSLGALRQRGVLGAGNGGGDITSTSAPLWWAVAGALLVARAVPPLAGLVLDRSRRATGGVVLFVAARVAQTAGRVLPLLVVAVTVAQLTLAIVLVTSERQGQTAGALLDVGGDARLVTSPGPSVDGLATEIGKAPGVRAALAARVVDDLRVQSRQRSASVRLVAVDATAYRRLLEASALPDVPALERLGPAEGGAVPALLLGGDPGLRDGLQVRWEDGTIVPLTVVGVAPRVGATPEPVLVVDARGFAAAGVVAEPDTLWAVGPGAVAAVRAVAAPTDSVELAPAVLVERRDAPLAAGLVDLALASSVLLLLLAVVGVVLAAATDAPARAQSLGRLRSLGLGYAGLRRVLVGELLAPVVVGALAGLTLGVTAAWSTFGDLSLERVTGQTSSPRLVLHWEPVLPCVALVLTALVIAQVEAVRLRRTSLARLLRADERA